ncbi:MAG: coproporphyrinogen III oxidase [Planctomycetota bacterium]|nr:MAG: coproporphyrinogen III oxidase [Planctomycetota bacterium]
MTTAPSRTGTVTGRCEPPSPELRRRQVAEARTGAAAGEAPARTPRVGLYVHVPFCVRKCHYCDFYSLATGEGRPPAAARYLQALAAELRALPAEFRAWTIYIGGGTPTELAPADLERLLALVGERLAPGWTVEWTCEANPGTLTPDKARLLAAAGVDRVSLGVQSFDDRVLRWLGRIHDASAARAGFELLRASGFTNINLDLIAAVPGAAPDRLERDLREAIALGPEHISCYTLVYEEGTPLEALRRRGAVVPLGEEEELQEYLLARRLLAEAGYVQYEVSSFCRRDPHRDLRCRHNLLYWGPGEYHGVGPGAHSHRARTRYANVRDLARWAAAWLEVAEQPAGRGPGAGARAFEERLEPEAWAREALVMALRRTEGVELEAFRTETGFAVEALAGDSLPRLLEQGLLEQSGGRLRLTERGLCLADAVCVELI